MTIDDFKALLEERTRLGLEKLGLSLVPDNLWENTELFEDSVKAVLKCEKVLSSIGWDYSEDRTSLRVAFKIWQKANAYSDENEASNPLEKLLKAEAEGYKAWMSPTIENHDLVELTLPFADPNFTKFAKKFFSALDGQLEKRFKLGEGTIFEAFQKQNFNFFANNTDLLEHVLLEELLGYKDLPENCSTKVNKDSLKLDLKSPLDSNPDIFRAELQLLCKKFAGIQFLGPRGNIIHCSLHIPGEILQDPALSKDFFSARKRKLENLQFNKIYSDWSISSENNKAPFLAKLRRLKADAQEATLPDGLSSVTECINLGVTH